MLERMSLNAPLASMRSRTALGGEAEPLEVVAGEDHLDGRREREQRGPREFVLRAGNAGEARAQLLHREFFAFLVDGRLSFTSRLPVFSPESTGLASRRLPVPATA